MLLLSQDDTNSSLTFSPRHTEEPESKPNDSSGPLSVSVSVPVSVSVIEKNVTDGQSKQDPSPELASVVAKRQLQELAQQSQSPSKLSSHPQKGASSASLDDENLEVYVAKKKRAQQVRIGVKL